MAQWGRVVFASRKPDTSTNFTFTTGPQDTVRAQFVNGGELSSPQDAFQSDTITAFAHDLGSVKTATAITFMIGHYHGDAINYKSNDQTPHFRPEYGNPVSAVFILSTIMPLHTRIAGHLKASSTIRPSVPAVENTVTS